MQTSNKELLQGSNPHAHLSPPQCDILQHYSPSRLLLSLNLLSVTFTAYFSYKSLQIRSWLGGRDVRGMCDNQNNTSGLGWDMNP